MRGTRALRVRILNPHGIIPAYAGNTIIGKYFIEDNGDHPRVCGEHFQHYDVPLEPEGSSPRMRGTLVGLRVVPFGGGIIPAYAGNTHLDSS